MTGTALFFEKLLDAVTPSVIAVDSSGRIQYWNRCAAEMFGRAPADVAGQMLTDFISENAVSVALIERMINLQSAAGEVDVRIAGGGEMRLMMHAAPIRGHDGEITGVVLQGEPVDERQRGESEQRLLAEVGAILSNSLESEAGLDRVSRLLVPGFADMCAFHIVDEAGGVRVIAAAYSREELTETFRLLDLERNDLGVPPAIAAILREGGSRLFDLDDTHRSALARSSRERELLNAIGSTSAITVAMRARGRTIGAIGLGRQSDRRFDNRDLRLAEEIARRAAVQVDNQTLYEAAVVANKAKSDFLAVISHELRTPLTTIMGYAELMASGVPEKLPPKSAVFLERCRTAAWHLLGLIEQILVYARLEAGRENLMPETVIMHQLLNDVRALIEPNGLEKGLTFIVDALDPDLTIVTDLTKVRQILLNLASNAVKFTNEGDIHIGARREGSDVVIYVTDTGIGISPEHSERIFDAFWQVDQSATRRVGGAGLGLSVSRRLARLLGGDLTLSSEPDTGTRFEVRLPQAWRPREDLSAS
jgi:PAS domain S-box-containing protein